MNSLESNKCFYFHPAFLRWKSHSSPPGRTGAICSWSSLQERGCLSVRTVLEVARRHLLPHSSVPTRFLHSSGPFPLWGPHHRCHRSCHCSLGQWGIRKPNSHCTAAPAAGSAPLRSESSLQGGQELWEGHKKDPKATGDEPVASKNSNSTRFLPKGHSRVLTTLKVKYPGLRRCR